MDIAGWVSETVRRTQADGLDGIRFASRQVYHKGLQQVSRFRPREYIYEREWDVLIVLDACRFDLFNEVTSDYTFISEVGKMASADTMTKQWMHRNFTDLFTPEMTQTGYVCGNPFSESELSADDFGCLDEVWRYAWDDEKGTLPARPVTDRAIEMGRTGEYDRMIVHYMQPHCPFIPAPEMANEKSAETFGDPDERDVWMRLRSGELDRQSVWEGYRANLEYVLDDLELLLENLDAERAVVTSDHGNALGEWGVYGHPVNMPLSCLYTVPWAPVTAKDEYTYEPEIQRQAETSGTVTDRLESLGYAD